jgi:hypothetical protein
MITITFFPDIHHVWTVPLRILLQNYTPLGSKS